MRTIRTKVYKFSELSNEAKQKAINSIRGTIPTDHVYDDAYNSVKAFHGVFGTQEGRSWLDIHTGNIEDNIIRLTGLRLRTWIINNYGQQLYKGRYFSLWSKTEISYKHHKNGYPVLKTRYSKVMLQNSCVLTGVCYDDSLLKPIYDFLDNYTLKANYYSYMDLQTLFDDCFKSLEQDIENEIDAMGGEDYTVDHIQANEYEFLKDGTKY